MKQVIEAEEIDKERWPARQLASLIDDWKNRGLVPAKVPSKEGALFAGGKGIKLYAEYQKRLKELNACDFGDLLLETIRLFTENPDILAEYHRSSAIFWWTNPGHQHRPVSLAAASGAGFAEYLLCRRRRPIHLRLARGGGG